MFVPARLVFLVLSLALAGCGGRSAVDPVPVWDPPRVAPGQAMAPVRLDAVAFGPVRPDAPIGTIAGVGCAGPFDPVPAAAAADAVVLATFAPVFAETMRATGLPVAGARPEALRPEALRPEALRPEALRPEALQVAARIRRVTVDLCRPGLFGSAGAAAVSGAASLLVCWTVVSPAHGGAVYAVETRGSAREAQPLPYGLDALLRGAFGAAATNLAADPGFRAVVRAAGAPRRLFGGR
ncbi:MAG: hypothetical protein GVY13_03485, partial [Alphaproteobacteria bacterium]|nr:hypothetical protein [Alphaproteobacteria bacterium]